MSELIPCPFCGGEAIIFNVGRDWHRVSVNHSDECILSHTDFDYPQDEHSRSELVEDWNSRTSTPNAKIQEIIDKYDGIIGSMDCEIIAQDLKKLIKPEGE